MDPKKDAHSAETARLSIRLRLPGSDWPLLRLPGSDCAAQTAAAQLLLSMLLSSLQSKFN